MFDIHLISIEGSGGVNITEVRQNIRAAVEHVTETDEPMPVRYHSKPRAQIVSQAWFDRAAQALAEKEAREEVARSRRDVGVSSYGA